MNNEKTIKVLAAIFTLSLLVAIGSMFYLYITEREAFKWAIAISVMIVIPIVLFSVVQSFFSDIGSKRLAKVEIKEKPKHSTTITYEMDDQLKKQSVTETQQKEDNKWW